MEDEPLFLSVSLTLTLTMNLDHYRASESDGDKSHPEQRTPPCPPVTVTPDARITEHLDETGLRGDGGPG